jgi:hypothetical protein
VRITGARVYLRDVMATCPESACAADLGPAPPAGSSRWVAADAMRGALSPRASSLPTIPIWQQARDQRLAGLVAGGARRAAAAEHRAKLPPGVRLSSCNRRRGDAASPGQRWRMPAAGLPKRPGPVTTTATVEILARGQRGAARAGPAALELSERAARPLIARGGVITLVVERRHGHRQRARRGALPTRSWASWRRSGCSRPGAWCRPGSSRPAWPGDGSTMRTSLARLCVTLAALRLRPAAHCSLYAAPAQLRRR